MSELRECPPPAPGSVPGDRGVRGPRRGVEGGALGAGRKGRRAAASAPTGYQPPLALAGEPGSACQHPPMRSDPVARALDAPECLLGPPQIQSSALMSAGLPGVRPNELDAPVESTSLWGAILRGLRAHEFGGAIADAADKALRAPASVCVSERRRLLRLAHGPEPPVLPPSSSPPAMASAFRRAAVGASAAAWLAHARQCWRERHSQGRVSAALVGLDAHAMSCPLCRMTRATRPWDEPCDPRCRAVPRLPAVAGEPASCDRFVDPTSQARAHRWSCRACAQACDPASYDASDPATWVDPRCPTGPVVVALACGCPPADWFPREAGPDLSRVPAAHKGVVTAAMQRPTPGVGLVRCAPEGGHEAARHLTAMVDEGLALDLGPVRHGPPNAGMAPAYTPPGTFAHPARIEPKRNLWLTGASPAGSWSVPLREASREQLTARRVELSTRECPDGKRRLIIMMNMGLNTLVSPPPYSIDSVPDWVHALPASCLLASVDTKAAFHGIYVPISERGRYCALVQGSRVGVARCFRLATTGFGSNMAPSVYAALQATVVEDFNVSLRDWGATLSDPTALHASPALAYADDVVMALPSRHADALFSRFVGTLRSHGFRESPDKCEPPSASVEHTGLVLSADGQLGLTSAKAREVRALAAVAGHAAATPATWRTVAGKLQHAAHALLGSLPSALYGMWPSIRAGGTSARRAERVSPDLAFSLAALSAADLRAPPPRQPVATAWVLTDASDEGAGAVLGIPGRALEHVAAPLGQTVRPDDPSAERELLAVLVGVVAIARRLPRGALVLAVTDSLAAVHALNRSYGRRYSTARATAAVMAAATARDIHVVAVWAPRHLTHRADLLSRVCGQARPFPAVERWPRAADQEVRRAGLPARARGPKLHP